MSDNDIFEMDSVCETDELEGETDVGIIDEEVGKRTVLRFVVLVCMLCGFMGAVWMLPELSGVL